MGDIVIAPPVVMNRMAPTRTRDIILLLSRSVTLMMTGYDLVMPVFTRRLSEFGDSVEELDPKNMFFALAQIGGAPFMRDLADSKGRRPVILLSLIIMMLFYSGLEF